MCLGQMVQQLGEIGDMDEVISFKCFEREDALAVDEEGAQPSPARTLTVVIDAIADVDGALGQ